MPYELRISGHPPARFEEEHAAIEAAAQALREDRNARFELIDLATNHPVSPAEHRNWHEEYKKSLGL